VAGTGHSGSLGKMRKSLLMLYFLNIIMVPPPPPNPFSARPGNDKWKT
jgi:hypothetical protein